MKGPGGGEQTPQPQEQAVTAQPAGWQPCRQGEGAEAEEGGQALLPFIPPTPQPEALGYLHAARCFSIILSLSIEC